MKDAGLRAIVLLSLVLAVFASCSDSRALNAAFRQTEVGWWSFDPAAPLGIRELPSFEESRPITWVPRPQGVYATDLAAVPESRGAAVAVSHLGMLVLDDSDGRLNVTRPEARLSLRPYQTGRVFLWRDKVFVTLAQDKPVLGPPASLAWWVSGQNRLTLYPVPSQVRQPSRQGVEFQLPLLSSSLLRIRWDDIDGPSEASFATELDLSTGTETIASSQERVQPAGSSDSVMQGLQARLKERLGQTFVAHEIAGLGPRATFTPTGWVAVAQSNGSAGRLYRLPELGSAGRYTAGISLEHGFVFTWEVSTRGYVGAAGMVHVPFAVLAP